MTSEVEKKRNIPRSVIWSTISNYAGKLVTLGTWFFLTPFVLHSLGQDTYGLWILIGSVASYGSLFDFGIASALTKYVAEYHTRKEYEQAHKLVATALWLFTLSGILLIIIGAIIAPYFPRIFNIPANQRLMASWVVFLSSIGLGISLPGATPIAVLRGLQRFDLVNLINVIGTLLYALAVVVVLLLGGGLLGMVAVSIPLTLFMQIPAIWLIHKTAPELRFGWSHAERPYIRTVASYSSTLFVINFSAQLQDKTDEIIIGAYLPISSVTPYSIAHRLSGLTQLLTDQFMKVLMPLASQLHTEKDYASLRLLYIISTRLTLAIFLVIGSCIVIMARPFLTLWVGPAYTGIVGLVILLTSASLLGTITWPASSVLQGMAKHRLLAYTSIAAGIANLVLSIVLIRPYGVTGVALGTLIPMALESIFLVLPYTWQVLEIKAWSALREIFLPALAPAIPMFIILYGLRVALNPSSYLIISLICGLAGGVYAAGYLGIGTNFQERRLVLSLARELIQAYRTRSRGKRKQSANEQ